MLQKTFIMCASLVVLTGLASAANMPLKASPAPIYISTWTGCYIGGQAGYGKTTSSSQYDAPIASLAVLPTQFNDNFDNKGFAGGGQAGCQLQTGTFLWGLEGDWSSFRDSSSHGLAQTVSQTIGLGGPALLSTTESFNQQVSYSSLWSIRGRFGGIFSDVYQLYVSAGVGGAKADYISSALFNQCGFGAPCVTLTNSTNVGITPTGVVFGAGAEWKIWPSFVIGTEYLHYALASDAALPVGLSAAAFNLGPSQGDHVHTNNIDVVRLRASWLFNLGR
jgi:outer membrane immunogenic protein